jgi:hypothetical protein
MSDVEFFQGWGGRRDALSLAAGRCPVDVAKAGLWGYDPARASVEVDLSTWEFASRHLGSLGPGTQVRHLGNYFVIRNRGLLIISITL